MYDVDKPHVLYNDEYLACLYKGSCDKISHLLNINTSKLNESMNDANGMPISRQTNSKLNDDLLSKGDMVSDDGSIKNELNVLTADADSKIKEKSKNELQNYETEITDSNL